MDLWTERVIDIPRTRNITCFPVLWGFILAVRAWLCNRELWFCSRV